MWIFPDVFSGIFTGKSFSVVCFKAAALIIPPMAICSIMAESLQGLHRYKSSVFLLNVSANVLAIILFILIQRLGFVFDAESLLFLLAGCFFISFLFGCFFLSGWIFRPGSPEIPEITTVTSSCVPLYLTDIMTVSVLWASQLIAGQWLDSVEFAHVAAAQRTAALTSVLLLAFNTVTAPRFASLYASGMVDDLRNLAQWSTWVIVAVAIPVVLMLCLFPGEIMSVFGEEFRDAAHFLPVLALGQLVNAATGSVGYLLMMSGHEKDMRNITFVSGSLAILLPFLLIPLYGAMGAVVSSALALALQNCMALLMVKKRLGFWTLGFAGILQR